MTSTSHSHPSSAQPSSSSKMTNANNEPANSNNQQELIKLLAQHFNNQLANNRLNNNVGEGRVLPLAVAPNESAISNFQATIARYQQEQDHHQYRPGQDAINFSTQARVLNLDQQTGPSPFLTGGQQNIRAQSSAMAAMNPLGLVSNSTAANNRPSSGSLYPLPHPPLTTNPFMTEPVNLFNALNCFGLPGDQFVLSLQQQYLIQAANAARQLESRLDRNETSGTQMSINQSLQGDASKHDQQPANRYSAKNNIAAISSEITPNHGTREFLKFGINTILGRGSPPLVSSAMDHFRSTPPTINSFLQEQGGLLKKFSAGHNESQNGVGSGAEQPISPDCDPANLTDVESESSSTPNLQQTPGQLPARISSNHLEPHQSAPGTVTNQHGMISSALTNSDLQQQQHSHPTLPFIAGSTAFPWTVASRGKPRRGMMRRAVFSDGQRVGLEKRFQLQKYISKPDRKKLAEKLGLRDSQVKIWFQNRRMKWRNSKERELLSAGGSREQTLPTRNNPNPDLSDVGETFKRLVSNPQDISPTQIKHS